MKTLRVASYGIWGSVGDALTPEVVIDLAAAFGTFSDGGRILVGRDTRRSSPMFHAAVVSGLLSTGCEVLDFGICPTPLLQFFVRQYKAAGAISVSAAHARMGMNALALINSGGAFIEPVGGEAVQDIFHAKDFSHKPWDGIGKVRAVTDFADAYLDALCGFLDAASIRKAKFKVIIDPVNGAGCRFLAPFAERLGFTLIPINGGESDHLGHDAEPRPRNANQVASLMRVVRADAGFVSSSDMGRLSLVSETGETASEEYTFPLIAAHVLARKSGTLVTNCCTTRTVDKVAARYGANIIKTRVGQADIMAALADEDGVIGGEGNGSVALPAFSRACDAFLMMGLILEAMALRQKTVSALLGELPRYHIVKKRVYGETRQCYRALENILEKQAWQAGGVVDLMEGVRVDWPDGWVHLRTSDTEPIIRIISESESVELAENRAVEFVRMLEQVL